MYVVFTRAGTHIHIQPTHTLQPHTQHKYKSGLKEKKRIKKSQKKRRRKRRKSKENDEEKFYSPKLYMYEYVSRFRLA